MQASKRLVIERKDRISDIAPRPLAKTTGRGKGRRSLEDMLRDYDTPIEQAYYGLTRIESLEEGIQNILRKLNPEARDIILTRRPSLKRYA